MADLIDLCHPYAKKKIVALNAIVGAGGAMNKNLTFFPASQDNTAGRDSRGNTANIKDSTMTGYDFHAFLKFGVGLEFNLNRTLALGLRFTYNLFMDDLVEGRKFDPNCDGIIDLALNMRIKLEAVGKSHARNIPGRDWLDRRGVFTGEVREMVEDEVARIKPTENVTNVYNTVADAGGHDTVIIYHDTIIIREAAASPEALAAASTGAAGVHHVYPRAAQSFYLYFDQYKATITDEGLIAIQQAADLMQEEPEFYALVIGYCDNTGTEKGNYELGDMRSERVAKELSEEYGIDKARIYATGYGRVIGGRSKAAYAPNRRVSIQLVDKETFETRKAELEEAKANRNKK
jgi:outer membrane protein OmpA-like peptidoglycan-associated protein